MAKEEYYQKLEELQEKLDKVREKYNKPTEWVEDADYKRLSNDIQSLRQLGYDS